MLEQKEGSASLPSKTVTDKTLHVICLEGYLGAGINWWKLNLNVRFINLIVITVFVGQKKKGLQYLRPVLDTI